MNGPERLIEVGTPVTRTANALKRSSAAQTKSHVETRRHWLPATARVNPISSKRITRLLERPPSSGRRHARVPGVPSCKRGLGVQVQSRHPTGWL